MSALLRSLAFTLAIVALGFAIVAIRGSVDGRSPVDAAPVGSPPQGGAIGMGPVTGRYDPPCGSALRPAGGGGSTTCTALNAPAPVIAEAPIAVLLPITAGAAIAGAMVIARRRDRHGDRRGQAPIERSLPTDE